MTTRGELWVERLGVTSYATALDLQREVEVEGTVAAFLGMEVDLPHLTQRVRLHEVALVVHVEAVVDRVVLELGDVTGDVDGCHRL